MATVEFHKPLNPSQQLVIDSILGNYENNVKIQGLHTADFSNMEEDIPSGIIMEHPIGANVHADSLPMHTFSYMVICPVLTQEKNDEHFLNHLHDIDAAVPQYCDSPVTLDTRNTHTAMDGQHWKAELGEDDQSFAGIFKCVRGRETTYYACVQAGVPVACKQLRQKLAANNMTFEELLQDPDYKYCQYTGQRNAARLAYNVARACQVAIRHVEDAGSVKEFDYSGLPNRAIPAATQKVSAISRVGKEQVGVFNRVTPITESHNTQYVYEGPYHGIAMFNMKGNTTGNGLPTHSGKHMTPEPARNPSKRAQGIICEGMKATEHPDIVEDTFCKVDSESFHEQMNTLGWKTEAIHGLIPVAVKIWSPGVRRK